MVAVIPMNGLALSSAATQVHQEEQLCRESSIVQFEVILVHAAVLTPSQPRFPAGIWEIGRLHCTATRTEFVP